MVGFRGDRTLLMALDGDAAHANGARVEPDASSSMADVGPALLGRVVDGARPAARRARPDRRDRANGRSPAGQDNPLDRARVTEPFDIGVRAVNALLTAGVGQRIAIVAGSGVGKSVLMGQMIAGADADVIVVGLIGERSREVSDFLATKLPPDGRAASRWSSRCRPTMRRCCACARRCARPRSPRISAPAASRCCC